MSDWVIRPFDVDQDAQAVAGLITWDMGFALDAQDVVANVARFPLGRPMHRLVAEHGGDVVGYGRACLIAPNPKGSFVGEVIVRPQSQRQGIGSALASGLEKFSRQNDAMCLTGLVCEQHAESLGATKHLGYRVLTLYYECAIDPRTFDLRDFIAPIDNLAKSGYEIKALAELPENEATDRALHRAVNVSDHDNPFMDYFGHLEFEDYRSMVMRSPWYDRKGVFVAVKDGEIVGSSSVNRGSVEFNGEMWVEYTGVLAAHRCKGLATALKARAVAFAKSIGGTSVRTENNRENPAMRAVNRKLGFHETPGQWLVVKELGGF